MKKIFTIIAAFAVVFLFTALIAALVSGQSTQKTGNNQKLIPADVMKIAENSCVDCHIEPGMKFALSFLNLSAWDKYTPEKQASNAKAMCKKVTKNKMPPKSYMKNNPDVVLTEEDIKTICIWSASLQVNKK